MSMVPGTSKKATRSGAGKVIGSVSSVLEFNPLSKQEYGRGIGSNTNAFPTLSDDPDNNLNT
jgi:hypothetical protein